MKTYKLKSNYDIYFKRIVENENNVYVSFLVHFIYHNYYYDIQESYIKYMDISTFNKLIEQSEEVENTPFSRMIEKEINQIIN